MSWHQDQVIEKPAAAEIAGSSAFCKYAALCHTAIGRLLFNLILNSTPCMLLTLSWRDEPCCLIMWPKRHSPVSISLCCRLQLQTRSKCSQETAGKVGGELVVA